MITRILAVAALAVAGCSATDAPSGGASATTTTVEPQLSAETGETFTYPDGFAITISPPTPYRRTESAIGGFDEPGWSDVAFEVRLTNDSTVPYDPDYSILRLDSQGTKAGLIVDPEQDVGPIRDRLRPGDEITYELAYSVLDPDDLTFRYLRAGGHPELAING